jgi:hypothetical protein
MWGLAGQDEMVDAQCVVLRDAVGDFGVAAHQRSARAATNEAVAGPEVWGDLQVGGPARVQGRQPLLPNRFCTGEHLLSGGDPFDTDGRQ